jgi:GH15 family glucan-1,4-alpha-glucosidase
MSYPYGLIGNGTSAALVSTDGSVDWFCLPYFDSPSLFAKILDDQKGGFFKITGIDTIRVSQEYVRHTPILKTRVETTDGIFDIYDYMPRFVVNEDNYYCPAEIQRNIRVIMGKPRIKVEMFLRPNYAQTDVEVKNEGDYLKFLTKTGEYNSFYLYTNLDFQSVVEGKEILLRTSSYLLLSYHQKVRTFDADCNYTEFERTKSYWLGWVYDLKLPPAHHDLVARSMITLKLLMYERTGAVIAAPTTSLPEIFGKDRNWDYRYCWVRDASMIIDLFCRVGHFRSGSRYIHFILNQLLLKQDRIGVMYGINGEKVITEKILDHLAGYKNSKPVRIKNDAYRQTQNDLYGELIDAIYTYFVLNTDPRFSFDQELWTVVRTLVNHGATIWEKPDNGIWEYRGESQHHVFSKLMNWVAMDRAGRIAKIINKKSYAADCFKMANQIKNDILEKGWNANANAFTMFYGSTQADAAVLLMLHYGFLEPSDPRMQQTVDFCYRELMKNGFAMRYTSDDDFGKPENAFIICTFWMVNALYLIGRKDEAQNLFNKAITSANSLGLFAEGINPLTSEQTGNFPQGYSHMAFVQSVLLLETNYSWIPSKGN